MADVIDIKAERKKLMEKAKKDNENTDLLDVAEDAHPSNIIYPNRLTAEECVPDLKEMNGRYAFVHDIGGKVGIKTMVYNEYLEKKIIKFVGPDDIKVIYGNRIADETRGFKNGGTTLGKWWLAHPHRKDYTTIVFEPHKAPGEHHMIDEHKIERNKSRSNTEQEDIHATYYNMWEGFGVEPKKGKFKNTRKHIFEVLCNSNREKYKYVMRWFAWAVQNPGERAGVALIFKGKKGSGKGTILTAIAKLFGRHGTIISDRVRLIGKHNEHLANCCLLFADEAYNPGDKEAEGILKSLITEDSLSTEPKFKELKTSRNCLHIVMATNADWVIPATEDERRYFINETTNTYAQGQSPPDVIKKHFHEINKELKKDGEGLSAMLYYFLNKKLNSWHPRDDIPRTEELKKQIAMSLPKLRYAFLSMLEDGIFPGEINGQGHFRVTSRRLLEYLQNMDQNNKTISDKAVGKLCTDIGIQRVRTNKGMAYNFPQLGVVRSMWEHKIAKQDTWRLNEEWILSESPY